MEHVIKFKNKDPRLDVLDLLKKKYPEHADIFTLERVSLKAPVSVTRSASTGWCNTSVMLVAKGDNPYMGTVKLFYDRIDPTKYFDPETKITETRNPGAVTMGLTLAYDDNKKVYLDEKADQAKLRKIASIFSENIVVSFKYSDVWNDEQNPEKYAQDLYCDERYISTWRRFIVSPQSYRFSSGDGNLTPVMVNLWPTFTDPAIGSSLTKRNVSVYFTASGELEGRASLANDLMRNRYSKDHYAKGLKSRGCKQFGLVSDTAWYDFGENDANVAFAFNKGPENNPTSQQQFAPIYQLAAIQGIELPPIDKCFKKPVSAVPDWETVDYYTYNRVMANVDRDKGTAVSVIWEPGVNAELAAGAVNLSGTCEDDTTPLSGERPYFWPTDEYHDEYHLGRSSAYNSALYNRIKLARHSLVLTLYKP